MNPVFPYVPSDPGDGPMAIAQGTALATAPYPARTVPVAVIAPLSGSGYADALARRGRDAVAVTLGPGARPPAHGTTRADEAYTGVIEYTGDLRRTAKKLRAVGVEAVVAASPAGVELAERIAWQLRLPGSGIPDSALLRTDRGIQAEALSRAGVAVPRTLRTASLVEALTWADRCPASTYRLASVTIGGTPGPVECPTKQSIAAVWPQLQEAALSQSGKAALVLQERVEGRQYVVDSVTRLGPGGPQHAVTGIWAHAHAPTGLLDRIDLLRRHGLLARRLSRYVRSALDTLGVTSGATSCHVAFEPERGSVLLSARVVTNRSRGDEAVWTITGHDPIDAALDGALCASLRSSDRHRSCVSRVYVNTPRGAGPESAVLQVLAALPTVVGLDTDPNSFASGTVPHPPGGRAWEIVLAHELPGVIERDYQRIRVLIADLHKIRHP
ncbi:hypothetical protein [Streptomyces sp. NPDC046909]|uniref:hypothetical protein n=1 Tax=Streptomyces sp. NPDC046909 TaxID=3155617 RepID=UPI0033C25333